MDRLKVKKWTAVIVIIAFVFQVNIILNAQSEDEIVKQFHKARDRYLSGQYVGSKKRIERVIGIITEKRVDRKDILGQCYLLLGAIYEKEAKVALAEENYRKAREIYGIISIDGVDLDGLPLYKKLVKGEEPPPEGVIVKPGKKKKKKFPWLLVAGGVIIAGAAVYFLFIKPKTKYQLTVNLGEGVEGEPAGGAYKIKKGNRVDYHYRPMPGYMEPGVWLDGAEMPNPGSFEMRGNHTLTAVASANVVDFVTDRDQVPVPEGQTASFTVKLSAQPKSDVHVTVNHSGGDTDIQVESGGDPIFNTSNWDIPRTVTLRANEDGDYDDGQAQFQLTADGITSKTVTAVEQDNDALKVAVVQPKDGDIVSREITVIAEVTGKYQVTAVEFYIDDKKEKTDLQAPYDFQWDTGEVADGDHGIKVKAYDTAGQEAEAAVSVTVQNGPDYVLTVTVGTGVEGVPASGTKTYRQGDAVSYDYALKEGYRDLSVLLDGVKVAASGVIVMNRSHTLEASAKPLDRFALTVMKGEGVSGTPVSGVTYYNEGESVSYKYQLETGYTNLQVNLDGIPAPAGGTITMDDDHTLDATAGEIAFITDTGEVSICEGKTAGFNVRLSAAPAGNIQVAVSILSGDGSITVASGESLTFSSTDWETFKPVTLAAADDPDYDNGQALVRIHADGLHSKDITAVERDVDSTVPLQVSIKNPKNNDDIGGDVTINAVVQGPIPIEYVEFYIDGEYRYTDYSVSYDYTWSTREVVPGAHLLKVIAYDACEQTDSDEITVTVVDNPPSVEITSPGQGPHGGTVSIPVLAEDYRGIQAVQLYVDGQLAGEWNEAPQTSVMLDFSLNTTAYSNGSHTLKAVAIDTGGQQSESGEINIDIQN
jgi:hypothetical protein